MIRDWKTGRFASRWKAERWPDRFSEKPLGILESERKMAAREVDKYLKSKRGSGLKKSFDTRKKDLRIVRDRFRKGVFLVELPYKKVSGQRRMKGTPESVSLRVNPRTKKVKRLLTETKRKK